MSYQYSVCLVVLLSAGSCAIVLVATEEGCNAGAQGVSAKLASAALDVLEIVVREETVFVEAHGYGSFVDPGPVGGGGPLEG